eukprot:TRINITY_DN5893_c0_g2_i1.p1 TRINITY_DN5893_c0_g2~~TRINITY_DN5893_c0_g2_i1.p1  ORF type:complete len:406 (-),score=75.16 TRINITY_DN5893_c0_g2_i1:39-1256(-)
MQQTAEPTAVAAGGRPSGGVSAETATLERPGAMSLLDGELAVPTSAAAGAACGRPRVTVSPQSEGVSDVSDGSEPDFSALLHWTNEEWLPFVPEAPGVPGSEGKRRLVTTEPRLKASMNVALLVEVFVAKHHATAHQVRVRTAGAGFNPGAREGIRDFSSESKHGSRLFQDHLLVAISAAHDDAARVALERASPRTALAEPTVTHNSNTCGQTRLCAMGAGTVIWGESSSVTLPVRDFVVDNQSRGNKAIWEYRMENVYWDPGRTFPTAYQAPRYPPPSSIRSWLRGYLLYPPPAASTSLFTEVEAVWDVAAAPTQDNKSHATGQVHFVIELAQQVRAVVDHRYGWWPSVSGGFTHVTSVARSKRHFTVDFDASTVTQDDSDAHVAVEHVVDRLVDLDTKMPRHE